MSIACFMTLADMAHEIREVVVAPKTGFGAKPPHLQDRRQRIMMTNAVVPRPFIDSVWHCAPAIRDPVPSKIIKDLVYTYLSHGI